MVAASAAKIAEVLAGLRAATARLPSSATGATATAPSLLRQPLGIAAIDALTGGGLARGRLSELSGPRSSGRMAATLAALGAAQAAGELVALIDVADALDVRSARAAGLALGRILWVRPRSLGDGLKALDLVLDAGGFGLVVLYACGLPAFPVGDSAWVRLARRAERARSAVLVVGDRPLVGSFAAVSLALGRARARFCPAVAEAAPRLLDGIDARIEVVRNRLGPPGDSAAFALRVADEQSRSDCDRQWVSELVEPQRGSNKK
jgi:hypothetical protein